MCKHALEDGKEDSSINKSIIVKAEFWKREKVHFFQSVIEIIFQ
jgi:hypothetical protein